MSRALKGLFCCFSAKNSDSDPPLPPAKEISDNHIEEEKPAMDPNAFTAPFQLTKSMRRDIYPAIDPKNAKLNASDKVVLINGASGGLGGEIARAWAQAGAKGIVLVARSESGLAEPRDACKQLSSNSKILTATADLKDEASVQALFKKAASTFGKVDVVINAAGTMGGGPIGQIEPSQWWNDFEVNVKGVYNLVHYFIKAFNGSGTFIDLVSLGASFTMPGMSSYSLSKLCSIRLAEYLATEHANLRAFAVHPGIVAQTYSKRGMVVDSLTPFAVDKGLQTGGVTLYLATPQADYLRGGFLSVNWDLDELAAHKQEVEDGKLVKMGFLNGKLSPEGHPWSS